MIKLSASIVVYKNDPFILRRTMECFLNSTLKGSLIVIDNSPTDDARVICENFCVPYIFNGQNMGFGKAHNIIINQFINHSDYHLVLNPDVYFDEEVLERLTDFMDYNPKAGLVMPKVLNENGTIQMLCKLLPTPLNLAIRRFFPLKPLFRKINDAYEMNFFGYNKISNVPFLSGCFMFIRTNALKKVGNFDERFFLYAEDTDLSRRIHRHFKTLFFPDVEITHLHARGSYKDIKLTWHNFRSAIQYFNKWGWFWDNERKKINTLARSAGTEPLFSITPAKKIKVASE